MPRHRGSSRARLHPHDLLRALADSLARRSALIAIESDAGFGDAGACSVARSRVGRPTRSGSTRPTATPAPPGATTSASVGRIPSRPGSSSYRPKDELEWIATTLREAMGRTAGAQGRTEAPPNRLPRRSPVDRPRRISRSKRHTVAMIPWASRHSPREAGPRVDPCAWFGAEPPCLDHRNEPKDCGHAAWSVRAPATPADQVP